MMKKGKLTFVLAVLCLATLACGTTGSPPTENVGDVATIVVETVIAEAPPEQSPLTVVYAYEGDVWLWMDDGLVVVKLTDSDQWVNDVRISHDGQVIAFTTTESEGGSVPMGVWAMNVDGTNIRRLMDQALLNLLSTKDIGFGVRFQRWEFIPGTQTLAFSTIDALEGPNWDTNDDLHLIDTDTRTFTTLLDVAEGGEFYYSPDGSHIAIVTRENISLLKADGSNRRDELLPSEEIDPSYLDTRVEIVPQWSTDSTKFRVLVPSPDSTGPVASIAVWEIPLDGSPASLLKSFTATLIFYRYKSFISPDLQRVAFVVRVGDNTRELHIADIEGPEDIVYKTGDILFYGWSPDSEKFVFLEDSQLSVGQLGVESESLANTASTSLVEWVDADRFLYTATYTGDDLESHWGLWLKVVGYPSISVVLGYPTFDFPE